MPEFRTATENDLPAIVRMLADDPIGAKRERDEQPLPAAYRQAFAAIGAQSGNDIIVAVEGGEVVGCLQLTIIPGLTRLGTTRGQVEGLRIAVGHRGSGLGGTLLRHAIERARRAGCGIVQLTTDRSRSEALRFYEKLGFVDSHLGMKLSL